MANQSEKRQAGTTEIEVTPAMIAAGASVLATFDWQRKDSAEYAAYVFEAMLSASQRIFPGHPHDSEERSPT